MSYRPTERSRKALQEADVVLNALDSDRAGAKQSWTWWYKNVPKAKRWPVPKGKDLTEAYLNGLDVRTWVLAGALGDELSCELWEERSAIMEYSAGIQRAGAERLALYDVTGMCSEQPMGKTRQRAYESGGSEKRVAQSEDKGGHLWA